MTSESVSTEKTAEFTKAYLEKSIEVKQAFLDNHVASIVEAGEVMARAFAAGHKLLICGNGGSAADAQHMAAELVVRLTSSFERQALPAIALTTDSSLLTACANDYSFAKVFSRQIEAFGQKGDVLLGISTSGNSGNVIEAVKSAKEKGMTTILLSGKDGGKLKGSADHSILVPTPITSHIQECHITAIHILCHIVEHNYCGKEV